MRLGNKWESCYEFCWTFMKEKVIKYVNLLVHIVDDAFSRIFITFTTMNVQLRYDQLPL